jgi:hypothetical protein
VAVMLAIDPPPVLSVGAKTAGRTGIMDDIDSCCEAAGFVARRGSVWARPLVSALYASGKWPAQQQGRNAHRQAG